MLTAKAGAAPCCTLSRHARRRVAGVGFAAPRAREIVAIDRCPILAPGLAGAIQAGWAIAEALVPLAKPLDIQVTATDAGPRCGCARIGSSAREREAAPPISSANGGETQARAPHPPWRVDRATRRTDASRIGRAEVMLPPASFLQATAEGEAVLARLVNEHVGARPPLLFSISSAGVGPFALRLAERSRAPTAVDGDAAAIEALRRAATSAGLEAPDAATRDVFRRPLVAARVELLRCRGVRSAAARRAKRKPASLPQRGSDRGRGVMQSGDLRARCQHFRCRRLSRDTRSPRSTSSAIRPMSSSWRALRAVSGRRDRASLPSGLCHSSSPMVQEMRGARVCGGTTAGRRAPGNLQHQLVAGRFLELLARPGSGSRRRPGRR